MCKDFVRDGICRFRHDFSYRHVKDSEKDMNVNKNSVDIYTEYIKTITEELKEIISCMKNQIQIFNQEIESSKKINFSVIVELVVYLLDHTRTS